ncbi:hypothetical protein HU200_037006 [Digitaria exilis]|uniref:Uncharacterized protein n=1 Tax=Digitaria exilis TaxID=1010633 RepID=A0A835BMN0_9POAL|nr:hypothetical protein HU200_037006 [Digitaria exilis]
MANPIFENPILENPIVAAAIDDFRGRLGDADAVDRVQGALDFVRAEIRQNAASFAEAEALLAVARRRYAEALVEAAGCEASTEDAEVAVGSPKLSARAAAYEELVDRALAVLELHVVLSQALAFFILLRAAAYAWSRAKLLPGVLTTVAAAYALAYAVSGGAVVPGPASLVRILVLLLCFLFGVRTLFLFLPRARLGVGGGPTPPPPFYFFNLPYSSSRPAKTPQSLAEEARARGPNAPPMADAGHHNPTVEALDDDLIGRIQDLDAVRRHVDLVRAQIAENDALYAEAATQFAQSRRRLEEAEAAAAATAASLALPEPKSDKEVTELALKLGDPEVAALAAAHLEVAARVLGIHHHEMLLFDALRFLSSWPGPSPSPSTASTCSPGCSSRSPRRTPWPSLSRITILLLCFLFGVPVPQRDTPTPSPRKPSHPMANPIPFLRNPIIAAVIDDLEGQAVDVDAVQRHLDFVRAGIAENRAIYADAAAQLPQAGRRLAEALFAATAAARQAPPESEQQQKTPTLPDSELEPDEEDLDALAAALAAQIAELAARAVAVLQENEDAVVWLEVAVVPVLQENDDSAVVRLEVADPEVRALADDYLQMAVSLERSRQNHRVLVQAHAFLLLVRAVGIAITRVHLLPGILLTIAAAYALAYAVSGGAVVPGAASLLRISALVLCFLFGVPVCQSQNTHVSVENVKMARGCIALSTADYNEGRFKPWVVLGIEYPEPDLLRRRMPSSFIVQEKGACTMAFYLSTLGSQRPRRLLAPLCVLGLSTGNFAIASFLAASATERMQLHFSLAQSCRSAFLVGRRVHAVWCRSGESLGLGGILEALFVPSPLPAGVYPSDPGGQGSDETDAPDLYVFLTTQGDPLRFGRDGNRLQPASGPLLARLPLADVMSVGPLIHDPTPIEDQVVHSRTTFEIICPPAYHATSAPSAPPARPPFQTKTRGIQTATHGVALGKLVSERGIQSLETRGSEQTQASVKEPTPASRILDLRRRAAGTRSVPARCTGVAGARKERSRTAQILPLTPGSTPKARTDAASLVRAARTTSRARRPAPVAARTTPNRVHNSHLPRRLNSNICPKSQHIS